MAKTAAEIMVEAKKMMQLAKKVEAEEKQLAITKAGTYILGVAEKGWQGVMIDDIKVEIEKIRNNGAASAAK